MARGKKPGRKPQRRVAARKPRATAKTPETPLRRSVRVNEESRTLFVEHHLPAITKLKSAAANATAKLRLGYKAAKADGFLKCDFDTAAKLATPAGEREIRAAMAREMQVAKFLKHKLGDQLDLFVEPEEDIEGQAYAAGEEASSKGKSAQPLYAPESEGYAAYMRGFNDHQEELAKGFKKLEPEPPPASGVRVTRSQFRAQQMAAKKQADAAEERALFTKRVAANPEEAAE